jgi:hypothetical protein
MQVAAGSHRRARPSSARDALGANSYIQTPTNYAMLEDVVRQLLVYRLVVNTPAPLIMGEFS